MKLWVGRIALILRYIITLSALPVILLTRVQIGSNTYAPWTLKPFGKGEGFYHAKWYIRLWTIFLTYIWLRLFFLMSIVNDTMLFDVNSWKSWGFAVQSLYIMPFDRLNDFGVSAFFLILSYIIVVVALLQLTISYELVKKAKQPKPEDLGYSTLFGWLFKNHHFIFGVLEPVIVTAIAVVLYISELKVHSLFFIAAAISIAIQGQLKRQKKRENQEYLRNVILKRDETVVLQENIIGETKKEKNHPDLDDDVAVFI